MKPFNVIYFDSNKRKFIPYDIMPDLIKSYNRAKPVTDIREFVNSALMRRFWARCEYEVILEDWPCQRVHSKIDIYWQAKQNFDLVVKVFEDNIKEIDEAK